MTTYFDDLQRQVADLSPTLGMGRFLISVAEMEKEALDTILLNSGDREFPSDLRDRVTGIIALHAIYNPAGIRASREAQNYVISMRMSKALSALHSLFHDLASRNIDARFGRWTDDPAANLKARDKHDAEV